FEVPGPSVAGPAPVLGDGPYLLREAPAVGKVHVDVGAVRGRDVHLAVAVEVAGPRVIARSPRVRNGPVLLRKANSALLPPERLRGKRAAVASVFLDSNEVAPSGNPSLLVIEPILMQQSAA